MKYKIIGCIIFFLAIATTSIAQEATIHNEWMEHNVYKSTGYYNQSVKGAEIHCYFEIEGMKGKKIAAIAFFAYYDGNEYVPLRTRTGSSQYRAKDNTVCTGQYLYPQYENTYWDDLVLFLPYSELSRAISDEEVSMACIIQIQDEYGTPLAQSEMMEFTYSKH